MHTFDLPRKTKTREAWAVIGVVLVLALLLWLAI